MMKIENFQHTEKSKISGVQKTQGVFKDAKNQGFLSMNMKILVLVLLGILVIMSFVQGMQMNALEKSFEGATGSTATTASSNANLPSYSQPAASAPAMVGGC